MTPDKERVLALHALGMSRGEVAQALGLTRGQVVGIVDRHLHPRYYPHARKSPDVNAVGHTWSEANLTEPFAAYKARRQAERAAMRIAA